MLKTHYQYFDNAIVQETARATARENSLQTQINFVVKNSDSKALDSLSEIVEKISGTCSTNPLLSCSLFGERCGGFNWRILYSSL